MGQKYYCLNMRRLRELVDRLNLALDMVAFFHQALNVAHKRGRVAADVDDALRLGTQYGIHNILMHSGTWRVGNNNVRLTVAGYELIVEYVLHVAGIEQGVVDAVNLRIYFRILDSLRHILYADNLSGFLCHEVGYCAGAGV